MKGNNEIVKWAIKCIETFILENRIIEIDEGAPEFLKNTAGGAFVSLHRVLRVATSQALPGKELRGCIGTIEAVKKNLALEIRDNAISAATKDPRFFPVEKTELEDIEVSVDILSAPEMIEDESLLDPGKYGVIVEHGYKRGLLLPDLEGIDTVDLQIEIAKRKAGIHKSEKCTLYRFTVDRYH